MPACEVRAMGDVNRRQGWLDQRQRRGRLPNVKAVVSAGQIPGGLKAAVSSSAPQQCLSAVKVISTRGPHIHTHPEKDTEPVRENLNLGCENILHFYNWLLLQI